MSALRKYLRERAWKTGSKQGEEGSGKWLAYCRGTFNILHLVSDTLHPLRVTDAYISPLFSAISFPLFLVDVYFVCALVTRRASHISKPHIFPNPAAATQGTRISRSRIHPFFHILFIDKHRDEKCISIFVSGFVRNGITRILRITYCREISEKEKKRVDVFIRNVRIFYND